MVSIIAYILSNVRLLDDSATKWIKTFIRMWTRVSNYFHILNICDESIDTIQNRIYL